MGYKGISGTPWHTEFFHKAEDDDRRHKSRCIYFGASRTCIYKRQDCYGSAHCREYSENIERLKRKFPEEYERKKKAEGLKAEEERAIEIESVFYEALLSLPLKHGYQFGVKRFKSQLRQRGFDELCNEADLSSVQKACEMYNKKHSHILCRKRLYYSEEADSFRCIAQKIKILPKKKPDN